MATGHWNTVGLHLITEEEPLADSNTKEPIAHPISSVVEISQPEEEQNVAGDGVTSTGRFATDKNFGKLER